MDQCDTITLHFTTSDPDFTVRPDGTIVTVAITMVPANGRTFSVQFQDPNGQKREMNVYLVQNSRKVRWILHGLIVQSPIFQSSIVFVKLSISHCWLVTLCGLFSAFLGIERWPTKALQKTLESSALQHHRKWHSAISKGRWAGNFLKISYNLHHISAHFVFEYWY